MLKENLSHLNPNTRGAIAEYAVCKEVLKIGYEVFKSINTSCSCDLVISNKKDSIRIEVRRGDIYKSGRSMACRSNQAHILALVDYDDNVVFEAGKYFTKDLNLKFEKLCILKEN